MEPVLQQIRRKGKKHSPRSKMEQLNFTAGDKIISSATDIANHFSYYFTTVSDVIKDSFSFINITPNFDILTQYVDSRLPPNAIFKIPPISTDAVINYVLKIPTNKATGIDGISCSLLHLGITELAPCLAKLINQSFASGKFPQRWKRAKVIALYKDGDTNDVCNYRPISILPILSKIVERHMFTNICLNIYQHIVSFINISLVSEDNTVLSLL